MEVAVLNAVGHFGSKFHVEVDASPPTICSWIDRPVNALQLRAESFHTKKLCSRLASRKAYFYKENEKIRFSGPFGVRAMYDVHRRLIGKLVIDFLLAIIELFFDNVAAVT